MNVLVTGGAGYIGSHTAKVLAKAGHKVVVLDSLARGFRDAVKFGPFVQADLCDEDKITAALREHAIDAVIHFAAYAYVGESMTEPRLYFQNNYVGTLHLLNAMHAAGVRKIVFSSTCATYGDPVRMPLDESHPQNPVNPYGESKLLVEKTLRWLGQTEGLQWVALRYFNACGSDPDGEIGENHEPETHLIPRAMLAVLGKASFTVFGDDYPTPDGTAVRDYIHVNDLASAHIKAIEYLNRGGQPDAFNVGTGNGYSVKQVLDAIAKHAGRPVPYEQGPRRAGDPAELVADSRKVKSVLGWEPEHSSLDNIVATAWKWIAK